MSALAKAECDADTHPYVDDTAGASVLETAQDHYDGLMQLMAALGLDAAPHKSAPPASIMLWIGVLFNSLTMSMSIDPAKVAEALELFYQFLLKSVVTRRYMQSLLSKVFNVTKC